MGVGEARGGWEWAVGGLGVEWGWNGIGRREEVRSMLGLEAIGVWLGVGGN